MLLQAQPGQRFHVDIAELYLFRVMFWANGQDFSLSSLTLSNVVRHPVFNVIRASEYRGKRVMVIRVKQEI